MKRGWNRFLHKVWPQTWTHTQWPDLMCVFFFDGREFMKIIALDICWNRRYGQLNTEREHSCTNMRWAIKWRMWIPHSGFSFRVCFVIQFNIKLKTDQPFFLHVEMYLHPFYRKHYFGNAYSWSYSNVFQKKIVMSEWDYMQNMLY